MGILAGDVEPEPEPETAESKTIDAAIAEYLRDVKATKSAATYRHTNAIWHGSENTVESILSPVLIGRTSWSCSQRAAKEVLNRSTTNKRAVVMLQAMRGAGADIKLRKGDWPKTTDKQIEVYSPILVQHPLHDRQDQRFCKTSVELHTEELRNSSRRGAVCSAYHPQRAAKEERFSPRVPRPKTSDPA